MSDSCTGAAPLRPKRQPLGPKRRPLGPGQTPPGCHHRRSIRLKGYDYTRAGAYFVTIVTQDRACLFGEVVEGQMQLNEYGRIVLQEWFRTAELRPYVLLFDDEFVVMPNHVHGIIWIVDDGLDDGDGDTGGAGAAGDVGGVGAVGVGDDVGDVGDVGGVGAQRRCAPTLITPTPLITPTTSITPPFTTRPSDGPAHPTIHDINVAPGSLGAIVRAFKSAVARRINALRGTPGESVWQRNYYEHIIRNDEALNRIRQYISDNPIRWELNRENPTLDI